MSSSISPFNNMLEIYQQMKAVEEDLQSQLAAGNQQAAEKDIDELQALSKSLELVSHGEGRVSGLINQDLASMEGDLNAMMADVQQGNFSAAETSNQGIMSGLTDIFHIIV